MNAVVSAFILSARVLSKYALRLALTCQSSACCIQ